MHIRKVYMQYGQHLNTFGAIKVFQGPPTSQLMAGNKTKSRMKESHFRILKASHKPLIEKIKKPMTECVDSFL